MAKPTIEELRHFVVSGQWPLAASATTWLTLNVWPSADLR